MQHIFSVLLCFTMSLSSSASADVIYKCKSPQGNLLYQEKPCAETTSSVASWGSAAGAPLVIGQSRQGHYFVDGSVNDQPLNFVIDTGASVVTLPQGVANSAGLRCEHQTSMRTGNGTVSVCKTTIQKLKFGTFTLKDVVAIIAPNLDQPLLGMNVLKQFRIEQDSDEMRLSKK